MDEYNLIFDHSCAETQKISELFKKCYDMGDKTWYRALKMETYYQELLGHAKKSEDEKLLCSIMAQTRESFNRIEESYQELQKKTPWANTALVKRLGLRYCDWDSCPILIWEYVFKYTYFPKHVGDDLINGYRVSTVWLGIDHAYLKDVDPIVFETMIFKEDKSRPESKELTYYQERYSYLTEAEEGHRSACRRVTKLTNDSMMKSSEEGHFA